jgi:hypothetical protein
MSAVFQAQLSTYPWAFSHYIGISEIYVDNQSTLTAITSPPNEPGSHVVEALNETMKLIATK